MSIWKKRESRPLKYVVQYDLHEVLADQIPPNYQPNPEGCSDFEVLYAVCWQWLGTAAGWAVVWEWGPEYYNYLCSTVRPPFNNLAPPYYYVSYYVYCEDGWQLWSSHSNY